MSLSRTSAVALAALAVCAAAVASTNTASAGTPVEATNTTSVRPPRTWVVKMVTDDGKQVFEPANLTIQAGDTVSWLAVSGSHNVGFWADSIPNGAAPLLRKAMPDTIAPLLGERKPTKGDTYVVGFVGMPKGLYHYYCKPHLKKQMVGTLTIQ